MLFSILLRQLPLYDNIHGRMVVFSAQQYRSKFYHSRYLVTHYLQRLQGGAGPLILTWINEICTADTEKRAITVALANDLAYVVQAVVSTDLPCS